MSWTTEVGIYRAGDDPMHARLVRVRPVVECHRGTVGVMNADESHPAVMRIHDALAIIVLSTDKGLIEKRVRLADIAHLGEVGAAVQAKIDKVAVHTRQLTPQESATEYIRSRLCTAFPNHADLDVIIERAIQFWRAGGLRSVMVGPHPPALQRAQSRRSTTREQTRSTRWFGSG